MDMASHPVPGFIFTQVLTQSLTGGFLAGLAAEQSARGPSSLHHTSPILALVSRLYSSPTALHSAAQL